MGTCGLTRKEDPGLFDYFMEKYMSQDVRVVPYHWPHFKSVPEVDNYIEWLSMMVETFETYFGDGDEDDDQEEEKTYRLVVEEVVRHEHVLMVSAFNTERVMERLSAAEDGSATNIYNYVSKMADDDVFAVITDECFNREISFKHTELIEKQEDKGEYQVKED